MNKKATSAQIEAMTILGKFVGQTVDVLTGEPGVNVDREFVRNAKLRTTSATLRGLEKRGALKIEVSMWKGASVAVLRAEA